MDLVGMKARESQGKTKYTVLRLTSSPAQLQLPGTLRPDISDQVSNLVRTFHAQAFEDPKHPGVVILEGEFSLEQILDVLGSCFGDYEVLVGRDNPKLPFKPPLFERRE